MRRLPRRRLPPSASRSQAVARSTPSSVSERCRYCFSRDGREDVDTHLGFHRKLVAAAQRPHQVLMTCLGIHGIGFASDPDAHVGLDQTVKQGNLAAYARQAGQISKVHMEL